MIDIKLLQKDFNSVSQALLKKGVSQDILDNLKNKSKTTKVKRQKMEELQASQNKLSSQFKSYKKEDKNINTLKKQIDVLKSQKLVLEDEVRILENDLNSIVMGIPNIPDETVPFGKNENDNVVIEKIGVPKEFSFTPKEHWQIGQEQEFIDFARGVKIAKSRFSALNGLGARLERALINYFLDFNRARGFEEWYVPFMANSNALRGTGQLPKFEEDLFKIKNEDLKTFLENVIEIYKLSQEDNIMFINGLPELISDEQIKELEKKKMKWNEQELFKKL